MKKLILSFLVLFIAIFILPDDIFNITAHADTSGLYTYKVVDEKVTITDVDTSISGDVTIPDTLGGYPVTKIGGKAFSGCKSITSVTVPDSITAIDGQAFIDCTSLTGVYITDIASWCSISYGGYYANPLQYAGNLYLDGVLVTDLVIPEGITSIPHFAFYNCTSITSVKIPDGVTSIGWSVFHGCTNLTKIDIPESVTTINMGVFSDCTALTSVTIPEGVDKISVSLFRNCTSLTNVNLPKSITSVLDWGFENCTSLTNIDIQNVTNISNYAFNGCKNLKTVNLENGAQTIGDYAFLNCESLESITLSDDLTTIGLSAFKGCKNLVTAELGSGITTIRDSAFNGCTSLESITIPDSVTSMGVYVFNECTSLKSIIIPEGVPSIGSHAFYGCKSLASAKIPESVTSIGKNAFENCISLESITIPKNVTLIDEKAFYRCRGLQTAIFEDSETTIGKYAFQECDSLKTLDLGTRLIEIGDTAFRDCDSLISVTIPDSVTWMGSSAFSNCDSLTSVKVGNGVTTILSSVFRHCVSLENISLSDNVTYICDQAFHFTAYYDNSENWQDDVLYIGNYLIECKTSKSGAYKVKEGTKVIAEYAFYRCESLTSAQIPDSVVSINSTAFYGCKKLTSINIPRGVSSISSYAFAECESLENLYISDGVTAIEKWAFTSCKSLTNVIIPESVTSIDIAFPYCSNLTTVKIGKGVSYISHEAFIYSEKVSLNIACTNTYAMKFATQNKIPYTSYCPNEKREILSAPTCTEMGYTDVSCSECGYHGVHEEQSLGHDFELVDFLEATCSDKGYKKYICSRCGDSKTDESAAVGHSFVKGDVVLPTPTSRGYTLYNCDTCGTIQKKNYTAYKLPEKTLNVTVTPSDIGFSVSWDAVEFADGYYVRIREKDGTTNITNVNVKGTSYEFIIGKNGLMLDYDKEYTIQVIAQVGTSYQKWDNADKITSKMVVGNRVVGITATEYRNGAQVTFRPVEGATKYWVFVRNAADDSAVYTIKTTETTVNIVNNMVGGTEYYVQVVAYADSALDSRLNALKTKFTAPYVLPSTYDIAAKTPTTFSITWDAVAGATKYFVQVKTEDDAPVRTVTVSGKTIAAVAMCSDGSKLSANTTYKFRIAATINSVTTGYGEWMTYTTGDYEPVTVTATKTNGKVKISWNDITDSHAVYLYKIDANGKKTYFRYLENGETSYTIKAPASGSYSYGVITVQRNISGDCYNPIAVSNTITF